MGLEMSRELWLLRHGKAERYDGSEDYDRRLKKRGRRDVANIAEWLKSREFHPDLLISSPATRAIMTARIVCDVLDIDRQQIQMEKRLYDEGLTRVKSVLVDCLANSARVLLVGHNPEFEDLLTYLVAPKQLPEVEKLLPTAAVAHLLLPDDWTKLAAGCAELLSIISPKSLTEASDEELD